MKKKSKYRPKGVRLDVVNWVLAGMKSISECGDALTILKSKNHSALTEVVQGRGNHDQIDILIAAMNMTEAYAVHGKGIDWMPEIRQAQDALFSMALRGVETSRFVFRGPEMQAVNLAMDIHDQQLEESSVKELEKITDYVAHQIRHKRARPISRTAHQNSEGQTLQT